MEQRVLVFLTGKEQYHTLVLSGASVLQMVPFLIEVIQMVGQHFVLDCGLTVFIVFLN